MSASEMPAGRGSVSPGGSTPELMTDAVARLARWADERGAGVVLHTKGRSYTYREFQRRAAAVAAGLRAAGAGPERRVALLLEEYDEFFVTVMGVWLAGAVAVPLNTSLPQRDIDWLLGKAAPGYLVVPQPGVSPSAADGPARLVLTRDAAGLVSGVVAEPGEKAELAPVQAPADTGLHGLTPVGPDELAMILFTSGTTGVPKGAMQTLRAISSNAGSVALRLELGPDDRIFINTPPYFTSGICHFFTMMANGGGIAGQLGFYFGEGLLDEMAALGCTGFGGAPAHLVRVVEPLDEAREDHPFRFWVSSGDHLPLHVIEKARRVLPGIRLFNIYGLTEVSGRLCVLPPDDLDARAGSVGRPIADMAVRVYGPADDGGRAEELPFGETGELYVTGSLLMQGYLDEPEITARTLTPLGFRTGDFGHADADGYVWIAGRKDDIIKRGGEKVSIVHVQQALLELGRFRDVAVIAAPDEILGHVPVAFVVPREPEGFRGSRVLRELRETLPSTSLPSRIVALDEIPRTGSGKAIRKELQRLLQEDG